MRRAPILLLLLFLCCGLALRAAALDYEVVLMGVEDEDLVALIERKAMLYTLADREPPTIAALTRRARNDESALETALQGQGYFGADVSFAIDESGEVPVVALQVSPGPVYRLGELNVRWVGSQPDIEKQEWGFEPDATVDPDTVLVVEQEILTHLMQQGYPFPQSVERRLIVDHERDIVDVLLRLRAGETGVFGPVEVSGINRVDEKFIRKQISWEEGARFDIREVARTRRRLLNSGVIARANINYAPPDTGSVLPIAINLEERKHRSIGGGLTYSTTREFIAQIFWEHRNLFGQAEKFRTRLEVGTKTYGLTADFNKPHIFDIYDLNWQLSGELRQEELEAYDKDSAAISTTLNYKLTDHSSVSGGIYLEQSFIEEGSASSTDDFTVVGLPLVFRYDNTDNLLNPQKGIRFSAGFTPFYILNEQADFYKFDLDGSHYLSLGERFVWANRGRIAVIEGQPLVDLPPDKKLYAGGGGSVRGYGHQMVGQLDEDGNPLGGRAAIELGTEGRYMFSEKIEAVGFVEGGRVTTSSNFNMDEKFLWGAGVGGRYHTAIGPIRVDVAVPLNKRDADDAFQFYISLGQAF